MIEHLYRYDHNAMIIESLVIEGCRGHPPPLPRPWEDEEEDEEEFYDHRIDRQVIT